MNDVVAYVSLGIWGIYFFLLIYRELRRVKKEPDKFAGKNILKHPFHLLRIDSLFFLLIYLVYNNFAKEIVLPYLYFIIVVTNIVYLLYDLGDNYGFKWPEKRELVYFFGGLIIIGFLLLYLVVKKNLLKLSIITLIVNLLVPGYVCIFNLIKLKKKN